MLDSLIDFSCVVAMILLVLGVFFVAQFVIERFILVTLPVLMEAYLRIRHSERYREE